MTHIIYITAIGVAFCTGIYFGAMWSMYDCDDFPMFEDNE